MGILYRNSQGVETPVAGLAPAGQLVPSVSLYQKGSITNTTSIASKDYVRIEITLNTPMPDTDYVVDLQTMQGHGLANAFCDAYGKTNSGFAIILANPSDNNVPANQIQVVWRAFKLMTDEDRALDEAKIEQNTKNFAPNFSATSSYAVGDYCTYQGVLYRCTTAHTAGAWVAGHFTQVTVGGTLGNIVPSDASASNKLVAKSDIVTKYNYSMAGTASLEDDIKAFVTALIALGANTYVGFFNRSGSLGTAGNYSITVYAEEGTSTFASGYIALGAGAMGKTQYIVSYYKPAGSSEEWTIKKLVTESENNFKYQVITTDSDLNNIKTSGTYSIYISDPTSQATNHAPTYGWLQLSVIQMNNSQSFCNQVLYSADGKMFMRECGNNTWSAWQQIAVNTVSTMTVTKQGNYINGTNYHGCKVGKTATIEINGDTGSSIPWEQIVTVGVATAGAAPLTELKCTADMLSVTTGYDLGGNAIIRQLLPYCRAWIGNNGNIQVFLANPGSAATSYTGNLFIGGSYITQ